MASFRKLVGADGRTTHNVQIRLKGFPSESATFDRLTDAKIWAQRTEAAIREGRYFPDRAKRKRTLGDMVDRFVEHELPKRAARDIGRLTRQIRWWETLLGRDTKLVKIQPGTIVEARDRLASGETMSGRPASPATVKRYLAILSKAFTMATKDWFWLDENPCSKVQRPTEPRGRVRFLSDHERDWLLEVCQRSSERRLYPLVLAAITTGARQSELLKLSWKDLNFERGVAIIEDSKNGERRAVPIVGLITDELRKLSKVRNLKSDLVFAKLSGRATFPRAAWEKALEEAEIDNFTFHDLRHTAASYLAMSGATLVEIAAILGHKTLQMVKRYAHLTDQHSHKVALRMASRFLTPPTPL